MDPKRRATLIALFIMTVLLAGVSIFITLRIQQNNAATDANASGFGATATTNKFGSVYEEFGQYACADFLSQEDLNLLGEKTTVITTISSLENNLAAFGPLPYIPFHCTYRLSDGKSIEISLHSYDENSFIDNSEAELFTRINLNLASQLDKQYLGPIDSYVTMFFGPDAASVSAPTDTTLPTCRANLFHSQNDFEYVEIGYYGFSDCNEILKDNQKISGVVTSLVFITMFNVNKKF